MIEEDTLKVEAADVLYTKAGKVRKRRPKKKNDYFTLDTQQAILEYRLEVDESNRNKIFRERIYHAFYKLAENIIHTYKFYYTEVENIEELKHEVVAFLMEKLHRYDPEKGKAYSYFGTITKRYLIVYNNTNYKRSRERAEVAEVDSDKTITNMLVNEELNPSIDYTFLDAFVKRVDDELLTLFPKTQEARVGDAILELFRKRENIEIFNKKALFIYIKEITDAQTPTITRVVKVLKSIYKEMLSDYIINGSESNIYAR